jgi:hypothetical protein
MFLKRYLGIILSYLVTKKEKREREKKKKKRE